MAFWTDYELLVRIVALIDITIYGLCSLVVGLFFTFLVLAPDKIRQIAELDPEEHVEISSFLEFSEGMQITIVVFIWLFWVFMTVLALLLLRWSSRRYTTGLSIWLFINVALCILFLPLDIKYMSFSGFSVDTVVICILSYVFYIFSIWVVWSLRKLIVTREGQLPQTVEFKAL